MESFGPFEVDRVVGQGGSAVVYAARRTGGSPEEAFTIALKVSLPAIDGAPGRPMIRRFLEEAQKMGEVDHPAIVKVIEAGELPDDRAFVAMPLLEGETLAQRLSRGPFAVGEAMRLFGLLVDGVEALHDAGLVHRDIKAENVFLVGGSAPLPILLDLGLAKSPLSSSTTTAEGVVRGTPAVMAPERFFGTSASVASDIYELGVLLYAMCAGRLPWSDDGDVEGRLNATPLHAADPAIDRAFSDALMTSLATRPEKRPPTAHTLLASLRAARRAPAASRVTGALPSSRKQMPAPHAMAPAPTPMEGSATPIREPRPRRGISPLLLVAAAIPLGAALYALSRRSEQVDRQPAATTVVATETASPGAAVPATAEEVPEAAPLSSASTEPTAMESMSPRRAPALAASNAPSASASAAASEAALAPPPPTPNNGIPESMNYCALYVDAQCSAGAFDCAQQKARYISYAHGQGVGDRERLSANETCRREWLSKKEHLAEQGAKWQAVSVMPACAELRKRSCGPEVKQALPAEEASHFCQGSWSLIHNFAHQDRKDANALCKKQLDTFDRDLQKRKEFVKSRDKDQKKKTELERAIREGDLTQKH